MENLKAMQSDRKVVIIGLDGATFDLIKPWIDEGRLPNVGNLIIKGVSGNLKSVIPPISASAWVSFMTGKNPGKHGILRFVRYSDNSYLGEKELSVISALSFKDKTLWELLSLHDKKVGVVNVPVTYPPKEVNGFLISCLLTPPSAMVFTYPEELRQEIPNYRIDLDFVTNFLFTDRTATQKVKKSEMIQDQYDITEKRASAVLKLMDKWKTDFFIVVFKGTDNLQHYFWDKKVILLEYYQKLDEIIKEIINKSGEDANVFVISDHGFGPLAEKEFHVNTWLKEQGLLKVKENLKDGFSRKSLQLAYKINQKIRISSIFPKSSVKKAAEKSEQQIDFKDSKAYAVRGNVNGINVNSDKTNEYEKIREEILEKLKELTDPETGEKVIKKAYKRENLYFGPYVKDMPDIILLQNPKYNISHFLSEKMITLASKSIRTGDHANGYLNGIFIARGPDIKRGKQIEGAMLIDIAPTILHLFGLSVPDDMDGRVLKEIFKEGSDPAQSEVKYQTVDMEKEKVKDRIRKLKESGKL